MEGKSLSKKAIVAIVIIAILVVAAISMVVVFLKDQGETEATAIGENNSNSEQTQDAVPENNGDNNDQGTATQSEEPQQEEQSEEQTTVANNDGATTNSGTTATTPTAPVQQTTTTTDGSTQVATTTTTETIPTQALTLAWSNMTVYGGELLANLDADVTDVTAPVRLATNILKDGESNDLREYYVKRGDTIYMYIAVNEELAHNPTFTLINNGTEYVMEDSLVTVRQSAENRWDYSVRYLIPEDTTFVDGEITLRVSNIEDVAGNSIPDENGPTNGHRVFYDGTAPEIHVKGTEGYMEEKENYVGNNEQDVYSKVSFKLSDNFKVVEYEVNDTLITGMTPSAWSDANFANIREFLVQGTNTITVRDIAGNESTYTFTYDSIAPVYSKLGILNKTRYVNKVEDLTWAKEGDEVRILISFPEKLAVEPTVKVFGKEYTATYRPASSNPEQNIYYYMVDFTLDETMPEGEIPFEVYGYADIAGNVGEKLEQTKINRDEYSKVIYDRTAPYSGNKDAGHPLYILNVSDANRRTWIKDGETLRVEANFNEDMDMSKAPILTIGTGKNVQTANFEYRSTVDGKRTFVADIVIDNNILGLADGTEVPFTVTNAFDLAGNEAILDNEDVTFTSEYGQVTYDNNAPVVKTVGMLNDTHYNEGKDTTVATTGDRIRLRVAFEEKLAVAPTREYSNIMVNGDDSTKHEFYAKIGDKLWVSIGVKEELAHNPSFTLINNGVEYPMDGNLVKANYDEKNDRYSYVLIYEIPEDTAFVDGEITFKISDLVDLFGNKMTDETKPSNGNRVFFDKTPATIKLNGTEEPITIEAGSEYVDAGATVTDNIDGFISSNYQFTYANYYADPNSDKVTESRLTEIDTRKTGLYKIAYIYTDKAGNTKQATRYLYIKDTTMPTVTLNGEENITIEAGTPYKDEGAKVTDNSDPTIENFKYTNINYYVNGELKKSHLTEVDVKQPGEYKIGYEYTDKSGNTKITVRTVIVKDTTAPVITANGKSQTLKVGDTYTELGATLTDNAYIDADDYEITIHFYDENGKLVYPSPSKVDTSKVGEYRIAYTAKDSSGNASNVATISVKVER